MSTTQDRLNALRAQYGADQESFNREAALLIQRERQNGLLQQQPVASTSMATPQSTRSGRIVKPTKPYTASPSFATKSPAPQNGARPGSSLNPNAYRMPQRMPLSSSAAPVPPMSRVSEARYQAHYSTYPARMRLGTSALMQPNYLAATGTGTNNPGPQTTKRQRHIVNYAEMEGIEESDDDGTDSDARAARRQAGLLASKRAAPQEQAPQKVWGDGKSYLGVLPPGNLVIVQAVRPTKHLAFSEDQLEQQAEEEAVLIPIQIDIDVDTFKIRDAFAWNLRERLITPDSFARVFCEDLDIPPIWASEVAKQINEQIEEQAGVAEIPVRDDEEVREDAEKDLRVVLKLDVQIGTLHLVDRIEWDISSSLTPELFAIMLCRDLSLSSSAAPLIAHAVHEELYRKKRTLLEMGLVGESINESFHRRKGPKKLEGVWREWNEAETFGPTLNVMSLDELDKVEADRDRALRARKREKLAATRVGRRR